MISARRKDPQYWISRGLLPPSAQEIADVIGREKALFLIGSLPRNSRRSWRVCFYVPKVMPLDHWLIRLLGYRDAEKLRREFGGTILQPSSCSQLHRMFRNREVRRLHASGMHEHMIAETFDLTEKHVRSILGEIPPEENANANRDDRSSKRGGLSGEPGELVGQG